MTKHFIIAITMLLLSAVVSAQECDWIERLPAHGPAEPAYEDMAFDSARSVAVLFSSSSLGSTQQTLEWSGNDWIVRNAAGPKPRADTAMVYDSRRGVTVLFGGFGKGGHHEGDTWDWNGSSWLDRTGDAGDAGSRYAHAMAFDSERGVMVMFGGIGDEEKSFGDTWEWDGVTEWRQVANDGPSPREYHSMAFDPNRKVTVLYGGSVGASETWEWDGASWSQRMVKGAGGRANAAMVFDSDRQACILFGGVGADGLLNDTWSWDGQVWTKRDTPNAPPPRKRHAMAYDDSRNITIMFGGEVKFGQFFDDTWELSCAPPPCYPDLNGDGTLDLFDFLAFVNSFSASDGTADCDQSGSLDLFDFFCFVNSFNAGC